MNKSWPNAIPGADARPAGAEKARRRLTTISAVNGWSVVAIGALCLIVSAVSFSLWGVLLGVAATASGWMELTGRRRVKQGRREAVRWLAGSQLLLLGAILLYAGYQILWFNPLAFLKDLLKDLPPDYREALASVMADPDMQEKFRTLVTVFYGALMLATLAYQGGLCLYYTLAARKVLLEESLTTEGPPKSLR